MICFEFCEFICNEPNMVAKCIEITVSINLHFSFNLMIVIFLILQCGWLELKTKSTFSTWLLIFFQYRIAYLQLINRLHNEIWKWDLFHGSLWQLKSEIDCPLLGIWVWCFKNVCRALLRFDTLHVNWVYDRFSWMIPKNFVMHEYCNHIESVGCSQFLNQSVDKKLFLNENQYFRKNEKIYG